MAATDALSEYKEGLRDAYSAGAKLAKIVADDNGSAEDVAGLLEVLATSHVLDRKVPT